MRGLATFFLSVIFVASRVSGGGDGGCSTHAENVRQVILDSIDRSNKIQCDCSDELKVLGLGLKTAATDELDNQLKLKLKSCLKELRENLESLIYWLVFMLEISEDQVKAALIEGKGFNTFPLICVEDQFDGLYDTLRNDEELLKKDYKKVRREYKLLDADVQLKQVDLGKTLGGI